MNLIRTIIHKLQYLAHKLDHDVNGSAEDNIDSFVKAFAEFKNVVVMCGAGLSTAAGIPDFRSPKSGIYAMFAAGTFNPEALFEISSFKKDPVPFYKAVKVLLPDKLEPTKAHYFIRFLHDLGVLRRVYTQNIDGLERVAGIPDDKIVEAHGSFAKSHCLNCGKEFDVDWLLSKMKEADVPKCDRCNGVIKPDVVLFGENLPSRFFECIESDKGQCDCVIIMGTSLSVQPFSTTHIELSPDSPRLLINKSSVSSPWARINVPAGKCPDIFMKTTCDQGVDIILRKTGHQEQFQQLYNREIEQIKNKSIRDIVNMANNH